MIRIGTGAAWRHDPELSAALRRADGSARTRAARAVVDAITFEVDGVDIAAGRAEGPLLATLEALLRAVARVTSGAPLATVPFPESGLELLIRRAGVSAFLTVVAVGGPSRVLARDVEVELEALTSAALEAAADLCRAWAELAPGAREGARLEAAARDLRRAERRPQRRPATAARPASTRTARAALGCVIELHDEAGLLLAYEGGRPDLGSLLVPGRLTLLAGAEPLLAVDGFPLLVLRDLGVLARDVLAAARGDARAAGPIRGALAHGLSGRAGAGRGPEVLEVDVTDGKLRAGGREVPVPALAVVRAFSEAALAFGRLVRARNVRQSENGYLVELEAAAADRLALVEELSGDDVTAGASAPARAPRPAAPRRLPQEPLGPGRLRRLAFRRVLELDVGAPAGAGLLRAGRRVVAAGAHGIAALDGGGHVAWRAPGAARAAVGPGGLWVARDGGVAAHALRDGRTLFERRWTGEPPTHAVALARGPWVVVERGALTGLDAASGRTVFRLEPPGAHTLHATAFGGLALVAADTGFVYGVDATGRVAFRVRAPGPLAAPPAAAVGAALVLADGAPGLVLLALDPASGVRLWETPLDLAAPAAPLAGGGGVVVAGTVGGDPTVTLVRAGGEVAWTVGPALAGPATVAAAGALLVVRDATGALVALDRGGRVSWSRPAPPGQRTPAAAAPVRARGALLVAGDGLSALDATTGALLALVPGVAPVALAVDPSLGVAALDADGTLATLRLATHLSVVGGRRA